MTRATGPGGGGGPETGGTGLEGDRGIPEVGEVDSDYGGSDGGRGGATTRETPRVGDRTPSRGWPPGLGGAPHPPSNPTFGVGTGV
jgi:hypothetical protein